MKNFVTLFCLLLVSSAFAQIDVGKYEHEQVIDVVTTTSNAYAVVQPQTGDAFVAKINPNGTLADSGTFPNDYPGTDPDDIAFALEITESNNKVFATAQTYGDIVSGFLVRSQSLMRVPSDLHMDSSINRLVAFRSQFFSLHADSNNIYVLWTAGGNEAKLVVDNPDGSGSTLLSYTGDGSHSQTWLLIIDANNPITAATVQSVPVGNVGLDVVPVSNTVDGQNSLRQNMNSLNNGNIVFEYMEEVSQYLVVVDPSNPGTTTLNTVQTFGPYVAPTIRDATLIDYNGGYALGLSGNSNGNKVQTFDSNFNLENESWSFDLPWAPYKMVDTGNYLKTFSTFGQPGFETTRQCYFQERAIESHKRGGIAVDWVNYFESFYINEDTTWHFANYQGTAFNFGGVSIPASSGNDYTFVIYKTDDSGPVDLINITDTSSDFDEVYVNHTFDLTNSTLLIPGDFNETVITLDPSATIPADNSFPPASWLADIVIPAGYQGGYGSGIVALMGTDPHAPTGRNRFFTIKIVPNSVIGYNSPSLNTLDSMKVWVTYDTFSTAPVDADGDGVFSDVDIDDNDPFVCRDLDGDGCDDCSQTGANGSGGDTSNDGTDTDGDGICNDGDSDDDNDGVLDGDDNDPLDPFVCRDLDGDGCDDCSQTGANGSGGDTSNDGTDTDGDGICDASDNCINDANTDQADFDNDGLGDECDDDVDGDGVLNGDDLCPFTPLGTTVDNDGCPIDPDTDGDGVPDSTDSHPNDPCLPAQAVGYTGYDENNPIWQAADCDGDGETNIEELNCSVRATDPYDPTDNCATLGIDDFENTAFAVYPNPTNSVVNIKTSKIVERIEVYNIAGQVVVGQSGRNISLVDVGQLPSGLYMLRMYSQDGSQGLKKIIKQ